ncbi:MAG: hypothetical protein ACOY4W_16695 [Thermodesulfobacteriota bacterium]
MKKIYTRVRLDIRSGTVLDEEFFLYDGEVAECKGGGSSTSVTNTYDPAYNKRMAVVAEDQQKIANQYFKFWESSYKPMETEQIAANRKLIPQQTQLQLAEIAAANKLLPGQTELSLQQMAAAMELLPEQTAAARKMLDLGMQGSNEREAMSVAAADVAQQFGQAKEASLRTIARRGGVGSGASLAQIGNDAMEQAKATAAAKTKARRDARTDSFNMLARVTGTA